MTAGSVTPIEQVEDQLRAGLVDVTASCRDSLTSVLVSAQATISGCQTMNGMLLAFLQSRAKESLELSRRLAGCGSPQNAIEIQLDYAQEALQAYTDQFTRSGALFGETLTACVAPWQTPAGAPARKVPELAA
jgi:hypothetical protein